MKLKRHIAALLLTAIATVHAAVAQSQGYFMLPTGSISSPVLNKCVTWNPSTQQLEYYGSVGWLPITAPFGNYAASVAPGSGNDNTQGYTPGSQWVDTTHAQAYVCTSNGTGTATWLAAGGGDTSAQYYIGASDSNLPSGILLNGSNPLAIATGGTGATSASAARTALSAAGSGANTDITVLSNCVTASALTTANALTSASSLATVGTVLTGVWNATPVTHAYGGTDLTTAGTDTTKFLGSNGSNSFAMNALPTATTGSAALGTDVALTTSSTFYDGPTLSLAAGTYLITGFAMLESAPSSYEAYAAVRLYNSTASTILATSSITETSYGSVNIFQSAPVSCIVTLGTTSTIKLQAAGFSASTFTMKAADPNYSSGNLATQINAVRLK